MQVWIEKYNKLQETCNAKERANRQHKMVLKFREEAIKKLEKVVKEKSGVMEGDDTAVVIVSRQFYCVFTMTLFQQKV